MDFMTSLKIADEPESDKAKERNGNTKRRSNPDSYPPQAVKSNTSSHTAYPSHYPMNNNHYSTGVYNDQIVFEPEDPEEPVDGDEDPAHSIYRERRNPLPPRFVIENIPRSVSSSGASRARQRSLSVYFLTNELRARELKVKCFSAERAKRNVDLFLASDSNAPKKNVLVEIQRVTMTNRRATWETSRMLFTEMMP